MGEGGAERSRRTPSAPHAVLASGTAGIAPPSPAAVSLRSALRLRCAHLSSSAPLPMNLLAFQSRSESLAQGAAKSTSPSSRRAQRHYPPPRLLEKWRCARLGSANWSSPLLGRPRFIPLQKSRPRVWPLRMTAFFGGASRHETPSAAEILRRFRIRVPPAAASRPVPPPAPRVPSPARAVAAAARLHRSAAVLPAPAAPEIQAPMFPPANPSSVTSRPSPACCSG